MQAFCKIFIVNFNFLNHFFSSKNRILTIFLDCNGLAKSKKTETMFYSSTFSSCYAKNFGQWSEFHIFKISYQQVKPCYFSCSFPREEVDANALIDNLSVSSSGQSSRRQKIASASETLFQNQKIDALRFSEILKLPSKKGILSVKTIRNFHERLRRNTLKNDILS